MGSSWAYVTVYEKMFVYKTVYSKGHSQIISKETDYIIKICPALVHLDVFLDCVEMESAYIIINKAGYLRSKAKALRWHPDPLQALIIASNNFFHLGVGST